MKDFGKNNRFNCTVNFDKYAIVYCEKEPFTYFENYLAMVKFENFLEAKNGLVKAAKTMQPDEIVPFYHQFGNYINYVDGATSLFTEVEIYDSTQDYKVRPFLPSAKFEQMNTLEREFLPKIIQGISTDKFAALLFEDGSERYFRIYFRYNLNKFELFFEMNNEFNNLKNLKTIDDEEQYDILSMDSMLDGDYYYIFVVTSQDGLTITLN